MIDLGEILIDYLVRKGEISDDEIDIYKYGFHIAIDTIVDTIILLLIGILTRHLTTTILFIISFTLLRMYTGGFHADTRIKCTVVTALSLVVNLLGSEAVIRADIIGFYIVVTVVVTFIMIYKKAPVRNENKVIDVDEIPGYRRKAFIITTISVVIICLGYALHRDEIVYMCTALLEVSLMMLV